MGIKNKQNRNNKKKKKANKLKNDKIKKTQKLGINSEIPAPIFSSIKNPFECLTDEQRISMLQEVAKNSQNKFENSLNKIIEVLTAYEPFTLIAIISGYGLTTGVGKDGVKEKRNNGGLLQSHIEILQAICLQIPEYKLGIKPISPEIIQNTWDLLVELETSFSLSNLNEDILAFSAKEKAIYKIQEIVRSNTQIVRNWGYPVQVKTISRELYSCFDKVLNEKLGFNTTNIIDVFEYMLTSFEKSFTRRMENFRQLKAIKNHDELVRKYHNLIGIGAEEANEFIAKYNPNKISKKKLLGFLLSHSDLYMADYFYFTAEDISSNINLNLEKTTSLLNYFSILPGELKDYNTVKLFLDNPIWQKPIIKRDGKYFYPIPQVFFSFILQILDGLIGSIIGDSLYKRRANYLEKKIEEIVKRRFPEALTVSGIEWFYEGKKYETDLITFIDSHAIIIEAKSHKITKPALRGAADRIKKHIQQIFIEPSLQSYRLEKKLNELILNHAIDDPLRKHLPVDLKNIHKVLRVSVTLEDFAALQTNLSLLLQTGWFSEEFIPCPTINLADFETLFDYLEHPVQIIHYLFRRQEIEHSNLFIGDEIDFMGLYSQTLFNFSDLSEDKNSGIIISPMSAPINHYYDSRELNIVVNKPKPKISKLFENIFNELEKRGKLRWTEIGTVLNMVSPQDQRKIEILVNNYIHIVNRSWKCEGHKNIVLFTPPSKLKYSLAFVLYKDGNSEKRDEFIQIAAEKGLEPTNVEKCLVIAKNIDRNDLPYNFIALFE